MSTWAKQLILLSVMLAAGSGVILSWILLTLAGVHDRSTSGVVIAVVCFGSGFVGGWFALRTIHRREH